MVERLIQHKHCSICGKAISVNEELCSEECKKKWDDLVKKKRLHLCIFYAMIGVFMLILILSFSGVLK